MKTKMTGALSFAAIAMAVTHLASASGLPIKSMVLTVCPKDAGPGFRTEFYLEYDNGSTTVNAFMPLGESKPEINQSGEVGILAPGTSQPVSLGVPVRTAKSRDVCTSYFFDVGRKGTTAQLDIHSSIPTPCMDSEGVFPRPALCKNESVNLKLGAAPSQLNLQCTDKIQVTEGSGHLGARVGGDCTLQ